MSRRLLLSLLGLGLIVLSIWAISFYRQHLQGIFPALLGPSGDVAGQIDKNNSALVYPPEFELSVFAKDLTGPRVLTVDPDGTLLVSLPSAGKVVALPDVDHNGRADRVVEVLGGLNQPHGLAFSPNSDRRFYVAETDRVMAYAYDPKKLRAGSARKLVDLPGGGRHYSRTLLLLPSPDEDKLLVSVGSSCDTCEEKDWRRAKILIVDKNGGKPETFASGLRNAVFMTVHPESKEIWATEMGRDFLGDDLPPDEINIIKPGNDYGWPFCYGKNVPDSEFLGTGKTAGVCRDKTPSFIDLQAHSAPLGLDFFPLQGWPAKYSNSLLVAYHGSWNRTVPTGYKIVLFRFDGQGNLLEKQDFINGWLLKGKTSLGRPVDIKIMESGIIYISDDKAGIIYRLALKSNP